MTLTRTITSRSAGGRVSGGVPCSGDVPGTGLVRETNGERNMSERIIAYKGFDKAKTWYRCIGRKFEEA